MSSFQFIWLTDIHLNFLDSAKLERFVKRLASKQAEGILIAGDIGEADSIEQYLSVLTDACAAPIYFVLGNHDYYRGSIEYVRQRLPHFLSNHPKLTWLTMAGVISLSQSTALIGHDSWADGGFGDYWNGTVQLNDFKLIGEFIGRTKKECLDTMMALGDEAAKHFNRFLPEALKSHSKVIVLTHVPPFEGAAWHQGRMCSPDWLPFFSCKAVGEVLRAVMADYPDKEALVFCGHTHSSGTFQALPNLKVITGGAQYGKPKIPRKVEVAEYE